MPLEPGQTLLHYRLGEMLGQGGMGTVYRGHDSRLNREVALKFLPEDLADDRERMARFTREAQVLASLNHPNIAGIHAVEEAPSPDAAAGAHPLNFLVMELVEGETLQERIARGPLPLEEALNITLQIAVGLEEAHERGIIHRDLKPANVKIAAGNKVKILDFGLAKAFSPDAASGPDSGGADPRRLSLSPTMTAPASVAGMLMGTAGYMSPEQARGEPADRRADIWALGVVLMEMLTGKSVHPGRTIADTLAAVLARDPDWSALPADTPRPVRRLLQRCLEKDSHRRLRDVGEARIAIEDFLANPEAGIEADAGPGAAAMQAAPARRGVLLWALAAVMAVALAASAFMLWPAAPTPQRAMRTSLELPAAQALFGGYGASVVVSHDGARLAQVMSSSGRTWLELQALDQWQGSLLTTGQSQSRPYQPFFSPDGEWIGYVTPDSLNKLPVNGGTPIKLCAVDRARGSTWGPDGNIVISPSPASPLMQVSDTGGTPQPLTTLDEAKGESTHRWPQWLPGGRAILFTSHTERSGFDQAAIELFIPKTGERRVLHQGGFYGRYAATDEDAGFITYINSGSLFAIPFDPQTLTTTGSAMPVIDDVTSSPLEGSAQYSISDDGTLFYASGRAGQMGHAVVWVDRQGDTEPMMTEEQYYRSPAFSPDGTRLAVDSRAEGQEDIWVYDIRRDVATRLTFNEDRDYSAVWSPDGDYLYYTSTVNGRNEIHRKLADGSGEEELVLQMESDATPTSISPDGKVLAFHARDATGNSDIGILRLDGDAEPEMLLTSPVDEGTPAISPDGRWLAYTSVESGRPEVYVRPLQGRGKWQISSQGGTWPKWSRDGKEIFFEFDKAIYATEVESDGARFIPGRSRKLFENAFADIGSVCGYDVHPDGQRFAAFLGTGKEGEDAHEHLKVVLNWFTELRALRRD